MKTLVKQLREKPEYVYNITAVNGNRKSVSFITPIGRQVTILQKTINKSGGILDTWAHQLMKDSRAVIYMDGKDTGIIRAFRKKYPQLSYRVYGSLEMLLIFEQTGAPVQNYGSYFGGVAGSSAV